MGYARNNASRLCDAADALLDAIASGEGMNSMIDVVSGDVEPLDLDAGAFTFGELAEAMAMLMRLGLVPPSR